MGIASLVFSLISLFGIATTRILAASFFGNVLSLSFDDAAHQVDLAKLVIIISFVLAIAGIVFGIFEFFKKRKSYKQKNHTAAAIAGLVISGIVILWML